MEFSRTGEDNMKDKSNGFRRWILVASLVLTAGVCHSCGKGQETVSLQPYLADESVTGDRGTGESIPGEEGADLTAAGELNGNQMNEGMQLESGNKAAGNPRLCYVHICGAVMNPGVYEVEEGQRIYQVVERAGGYTQDAASDYLNLAAAVSDGMKLTVPTQEELQSESGESIYGISTPQDTAAESGSAKINLNTAAKEQLMGLSGIGEARAGDIIRYREEHGGFKKIEDIMKIPGIKDAAFQKIKDQVTV